MACSWKAIPLTIHGNHGSDRNISLLSGSWYRAKFIFILVLDMIESSIFNATNGKPNGSVTNVNECITGICYVEIFRHSTGCGTGPVAANCIYVAKWSAEIATKTCHGQFQGRSECTGSTVTAPVDPLCIQFSLRWQSISAWTGVVHAISTLP